jgi:PPOX class probable F420-dependent enzyme
MAETDSGPVDPVPVSSGSSRGRPSPALPEGSVTVMRKDLTIEDLGDLAELPLLAVLATYRRDGTVLLSPVWHEWSAGGFQVVTGSRDVKAAHLRRDPRASIVVCEATPPYRGVEVRCHARLASAGPDAVRRMASRYLGPEAGAAYAESASDDLLIRLEPGDLRAWDFADEYA